MKSQNELQVFVQSPIPQFSSRFLTVNPHTTLQYLKHSILPKTMNTQSLDSFYFSFNGKPLKNSSNLISSNIPPFSTLILLPRVFGGGGDGGATGAESRDCYLNMYAEKKPDKIDPNETRLSKWTTCALTFEPLKHPCVVDKLGNVFNKEPLVEALLGKKLSKAFGHIKGLKDMIPIELSTIPGVEFDDKNISFETRFQCPITGLEFNGKYKFFALRGCGHVLSAKALKEVKSSACLVCHSGFSESDKIVINGSAEEVAELREKMEVERAKLREKKEKKAKNGEQGVDLDSSRLSGTKHGVDERAVSSSMVNKETNGKIVKPGDGVKLNGNGSVKRFKAVDHAPANATKEVYASIFTSSRKSKFKETYSCRSLPLGRN